jgi:hypothetical protein
MMKILSAGVYFHCAGLASDRRRCIPQLDRQSTANTVHQNYATGPLAPRR